MNLQGQAYSTSSVQCNALCDDPNCSISAVSLTLKKDSETVLPYRVEAVIIPIHSSILPPHPPPPAPKSVVSTSLSFVHDFVENS